MAGDVLQYVWLYYLPAPNLQLISSLMCKHWEYKYREYNIRNLFTEEGGKEVIFVSLLQTAGTYRNKGKSYGRTLQSLHSVDFPENQGGFGQGCSLVKIHVSNLISKK